MQIKSKLRKCYSTYRSVKFKKREKGNKPDDHGINPA